MLLIQGQQHKGGKTAPKIWLAKPRFTRVSTDLAYDYNICIFITPTFIVISEINYLHRVTYLLFLTLVNGIFSLYKTHYCTVYCNWKDT